MVVVYEIHTHRDGAWKIDSLFDDRDLAVLEANRLERSKHSPMVRVVEETFDKATDQKVSRTIYRTPRSEPAAPAVAAAAEAKPRKFPAPKEANRPAPVIKSEKPISSTSWRVLVGIATVAAVLVCSYGAFQVLRLVAG